MRVAIYARVSTGEQNPELQLRELRDYAERRGFIIHREYVETVTGDARRRKRAPEFEAMMADARRRRFDCVLVWKYDRFARSLGALVAALQEFRDLGVDFISHTQAIDTTTPMGRLFFHIIGSFAEFERAMIRERTSAGLAAARAEGRIGGRRKKLESTKRNEIAESVVSGRKSGAEMARLYNVSQPTVSRIVAEHLQPGSAYSLNKSFGDSQYT